MKPSQEYKFSTKYFSKLLSLASDSHNSDVLEIDFVAKRCSHIINEMIKDIKEMKENNI